MKYELLPKELQTELESKKFAMIRRGSLIGDHSINDAILFDFGSDVLKGDTLDRLNGYHVGHVRDWFEYITSPLGEDVEKASSVVKNALISVSRE